MIINSDTVYRCINSILDLNVTDVPIKYVDPFHFYKKIKSNYPLPKPLYEDVGFVKEHYQLICEIIPGIYKWKERSVIIKNEHIGDFSLLLTELLHSKSITQNHKEIQDWLKEGIPHYLAKYLCMKCKIPYSKSEHSEYFQFWEKIHEKYGLDTIKTILYAEDIRISISIMKTILNYSKNDILSLSFEEVVTFLKKK